MAAFILPLPELAITREYLQRVVRKLLDPLAKHVLMHVQITVWFGMWAPKGTPQEVISKPNVAVVDALAGRPSKIGWPIWTKRFEHAISNPLQPSPPSERRKLKDGADCHHKVLGFSTAVPPRLWPQIESTGTLDCIVIAETERLTLD